MPTEPLAPGAAGQGREGAPADEGGQGFDFARAYEQLRPEFTRATQELSSTRERLSEFEGLFEALHDPDPEVQAAAMDALGLEPAVDTGPSRTQDEFVDPLEEEVKELRAWRESLERERELEASRRDEEQLATLRDEYIDEAIGYIETEMSRQTGGKFKFSEQEMEILGNLAIAMEDDQGMPDVQGAYNRLYGSDGFLETHRSQWIETKTGAPQAPLGRTIPADQKPKTAADRIAYIDQRWSDLENQR